MTHSVAPARAARETNEETPVAAHFARPAWFSLGALTLALIEGVCAGLVLLKGTAVFASLFGLMAAGASSWLHRDAVRIPGMLVAGALALANLYTVWNGWRLRRSPAASWRVRPLTSSERRRVALVVAASLFTLLLLATEVYGHHVLHAG